MKKQNLAGTTAFLALMSGSGAFAQVTPEEVWQNWQDLSTSYGQTITATSAARNGDTLKVEGVSITFSQDGTSVDGSIDKINFRDLGDGTVEVTMSDSYPIKMTVPAVEGEEGSTATDLTIKVSQPGLVIIAGGSTSETSYSFTAPSMGIKLTSIEGVDAGVVDATAEATLTGVSGNYLVGGDETAMTLASSFAAQSMALAVVGADKETQSDVRITATVADLEGTTKGNFLGAEAMTDLAAALKAGFNSEGSFSHGAVSFDVDVVDAGAPTKIMGSATSGNMTFALDSSQLKYGTGNKDVSITVQSPDIPFPEVKVTYAELGFNVLMPVAKTDAPADFAFLTKIVDLSISDEIWGMLDPTGSLPHDPATLVIDTKGSVTLTTDLMDEAQMAALGETPPGEIHSLDVTELRANVAGAALTGAGSFTFDNTDLTTFEGVPAPTGKIDLKLIGGNGLMDKLVAMGLLSEEDVMGARMMLSMFANAGPGEDELNSTLEFKDKGFFANGQQLQ